MTACLYPYAQLTEDDLVNVTGYDQPKRQRDWLNRNGVGYLIRADGRPITTWGALDQAMSGHRDESPRFSAVR
ncbi:MAG: DUF4224 domain-containing protein [Abyssibacter sp.]|jgi:hypothetical protein|uniref:DUF4224 domain-containing protein n=1 Tax=Abyssibacter sp. TaxID=2320200 RepID=UPI003219BAEE